MSLKSEILHRFSLRQRMLAIIIVAISIWWASANTLAQEAALAALACPSASNPIARPVGQFSSVDRIEKEESGPIVLSRLFEPASGIGSRRDFHAERTIRGETLQSSPHHAEPKAYSLLHERSASGFLLYGDQMNHFLATQSLANHEFATHEVEHAPLPLVQLKFGGWEIPVVLSNATVSR